MADRSVNVNIGSQYDGAGTDKAVEALDHLQEKAGHLSEVLKIGGGVALGEAIGEAIRSIPQLFETAIHSAIEYNAELETTKIGIAAAFTQNNVGGVSDFNEQLKAAGPVLDSLREKSRVFGLSFTDVGESYRINVSALIKGGISDIDQQVDAVIRLNQALASVGVTGQQARRDTIDILQGLGDRTIAGKELGFTGEAVKEAEGAGHLYDLILEKTKGLTAANEATRNSFAGLTGTLKNEIQAIQGTAGEPIFESLKTAIRALNEELKKPEVADQLERLGFGIARIVDSGAGLLKFALDNAGALATLSQAAAGLGAALGAVKILAFIEALVLKRLAITADTVATEANTVATVANKEAQAGLGGAAAKTGASLAGAFSVLNAGVLGGLAAKGVIDALTDTLDANSAAAERAGQASLKFVKDLKTAVEKAPTVNAGEDIVFDSYFAKIDVARKKLDSLKERQFDAEGNLIDRSRDIELAAEELRILVGARDSRAATVAQEQALAKAREKVVDLGKEDLETTKKAAEIASQRAFDALSPLAKERSAKGSVADKIEETKSGLRADGVSEEALTSIKSAADLWALTSTLSGKAKSDAAGYYLALQPLEDLARKTGDENKKAAEGEAAGRKKAADGIDEANKKLDEQRGKLATERAEGKDTTSTLAAINELEKKRNDLIDYRTGSTQKEAAAKAADDTAKRNELLDKNPDLATEIDSRTRLRDELRKKATGDPAEVIPIRALSEQLAGLETELGKRGTGKSSAPRGDYNDPEVNPFRNTEGTAAGGIPSLGQAAEQQSATSSAAISTAGQKITSAIDKLDGSTGDVLGDILSNVQNLITGISGLKQQVASHGNQIQQLFDDTSQGGGE